MVVFMVSAVIAVVATILAITRLHAVHALLYFIVSLLAVAMVFYELGAPFLAVLEVIIYAGAIMVLFVFVMMMLNMGREAVEQERRWLSPKMFIGPVILAILLGIELGVVMASQGISGEGITVITPRQVGTAMYTIYPIAVEIAALLLLAGLVGAFHLGHDEREQLPHVPQRSFKQRISRRPGVTEEDLR